MRVRVIVQLKPPNPPSIIAAEPRSEHRSAKRLPVDYRFSIFSGDETGQRYIPARGINMSRSGALVEADEPVVIGSLVSVKVNRLGLTGSASVRHCTVKGAKFRIGLFFPNPLSQSQ
jgi:PilZ domain